MTRAKVFVLASHGKSWKGTARTMRKLLVMGFLAHICGCEGEVVARDALVDTLVDASASETSVSDSEDAIAPTRDLGMDANATRDASVD